MQTVIIVAALSLIGTLTGSLGGILVSSRLTNYRLEQLERKVDRHNRFAERMPVVEEQLKNTERRLTELENDR